MTSASNPLLMGKIRLMRRVSSWLGLMGVLAMALNACEEESDPGTSTVGSAGGAAGGAGGGGGTGGAAPWSPTAEQVAACDAWHAVLCTKVQECLPVNFEVLYGDLPGCIESERVNCLVKFAPGSPETTEKLGTCTATVDRFDCSAYLRLFAAEEVPVECAPIAGALADGATCIASSQCTSTYCEFPVEGASCGTCARRGQVGEPCVFRGCELGLTCAYGVCRAPGDVDAACASTQPCMYDLDCIADVCAPALQVDEPCVQAPQQCGHALVCNLVTHTCEAYGFAPTGSPCGRDTATGSFSFCEHGAHCKITTGNQGVCMPAVPEGGDCSGDWYTGPCAFPLRCVQGACEALDVNACL